MSMCGEPMEMAQTKFEMFAIIGTFGTTYVLPEVLYSGVQLAPEKSEVMGHPWDLSDSNGQLSTLQCAIIPW